MNIIKLIHKTVNPRMWLLASVVTIGLVSLGIGGQLLSLKPSVAMASGVPTDCSSDVTANLNQYLANQPDGVTINLPANACYQVNGSLNIIDRHNITVNGNGAQFESKVLPPKGSVTPMWHIVGGSHITINNVTVTGLNPTGQYNSNYEHVDAFNVRGASYVTLDNVKASHVYGDFVNLGPDTRTQQPGGVGAIPASHITIENSGVNITGRNGVSCTDCSDVSVTNSSFYNIGYEGFDLEIEAPSWVGDNISVTNNTYGTVHLTAFNGSGAGAHTNNVNFSNNTMVGYNQACGGSGVAAVRLDSGTPRNGVTISGNTLRSLYFGIWIEGGKNIVVNNNNVMTSGVGCRDTGIGIHVGNIDTLTVKGNDFSGSTAGNFKLYTVKLPLNNYTACGNRTVGETAFDQPVPCSN